MSLFGQILLVRYSFSLAPSLPPSLLTNLLHLDLIELGLDDVALRSLLGQLVLLPAAGRHGHINLLLDLLHRFVITGDILVQLVNLGLQAIHGLVQVALVGAGTGGGGLGRLGLAREGGRVRWWWWRQEVGAVTNWSMNEVQCTCRVMETFALKGME